MRSEPIENEEQVGHEAESNRATAPIVIVNAWHDDNAGDSAIADVCITFAKELWPKAPILVHTMLSRSDPKYSTWHRHLKVQHPDVNFCPGLFPEPVSGGRWRKVSLVARSLASLPLLLPGLPTTSRRRVTAYLSSAQRVIVVGGSDLFELRHPVLTSSLRLRRLLEPCRIAAKLKVPFHLWGHTIGPFEGGRGEKFMRGILNAAAEVIVREDISRGLAHTIAPESDPVTLPDLAFALSVGDDTGRVLSGRYAALVPRGHILDEQVGDEPRLVKEFAQLALKLLEQGEVDRVFVVPQVVGPSSVEDDEGIVRKIVERAAHPMVAAIEGGLSPRQLQTLYAHAAGVIAVRLHGAILSIAAGTPAYAISYFTAKTQGVLEGARMHDSWTTIEKFDAERAMVWWRNSTGREARERVSRTAAEHRASLRQLIGPS
jgi:polysaccharide pyruvyl transferase WcaK-like protein